uniref:Uncharacterized protein n=1 Tax=viral metagenome TaxID=1070528 RepID=A0A6M3LNQ6_9ZZZZ
MNYKIKQNIDEIIWLVEYPRIIQNLAGKVYKEIDFLSPLIFQHRLLEEWEFYVRQN